jgi:hypothetical protein
MYDIVCCVFCNIDRQWSELSRPLYTVLCLFVVLYFVVGYSNDSSSCDGSNNDSIDISLDSACNGGCCCCSSIDNIISLRV